MVCSSLFSGCRSLLRNALAYKVLMLSRRACWYAQRLVFRMVYSYDDAQFRDHQKIVCGTSLHLHHRCWRCHHQIPVSSRPRTVVSYASSATHRTSPCNKLIQSSIHSQTRSSIIALCIDVICQHDWRQHAVRSPQQRPGNALLLKTWLMCVHYFSADTVCVMNNLIAVD